MTNKNKNQPKGNTAEQSVPIQDQRALQTLVGERDENLRTIERELEIEIGRDRNGLLLRGQDSEVALAADLLNQLLGLVAKGHPVFSGDVARALKMLAADRHLKLDELFREQVTISGRRFPIVPKTPKQKLYLDAIRSHDLVFGVGPAGTGKTYLAMAMAVAALTSKEVKRVVLCRPAVEAGEKLGFLPGDMAEKVNPYLRPLYDALHDMVEFERAQELMEKGNIEVAPLAFMRGRTLSNAFVILDESQNTTAVQMKMFLTRLGHNSKCVVTGDDTQIDLPRGVASGLEHAVKLLSPIRGIAMVHFDKEDVIRHPLVSRIVEAYEAEGIVG